MLNIMLDNPAIFGLLVVGVLYVFWKFCASRQQTIFNVNSRIKDHMREARGLCSWVRGDKARPWPCAYLSLADLASLLMQHSDIETCLALTMVCKSFHKIIHPILLKIDDESEITIINKILGTGIKYGYYMERYNGGGRRRGVERTGHLHYKRNILNGNNHGLYQTWWHTSFKLKSEYLYFNGYKHGPCQKWDESGNLEKNGNYLSGKKHGVFQLWHTPSFWSTRRVLWREDTYLNGVLHGLSQTWWVNGKIRGFANYVYGLKDGSSKTWDESGKLVTECFYTKGFCDCKVGRHR